MTRLLFLLTITALITQSLAIHCGTAASWMDQERARASGVPSARTAAVLSSNRILTTTHFSVRYTMGRNLHRPHLTAQDSSLLRKADSIYNSSPTSMTSTQKDQAINRGLDSLNASHPIYVLKAAAYFERAYAFYADSLGMSMPKTGPCVIEIADISGATYGYTFSSTSILIENDFLYEAALDANGRIIGGTPIRAVMNGQLLHDYAVDWDLGLKVTASHEYYHAVQYGYTPNPGANFHAWYELSATGMEERLAPEVNDYFQYLPYVLQHHETVSLLTEPPAFENYGNGIFHQYLTSRLGSKFDVNVWSALSTNGNKLPQALTFAATASSFSFDSLYASYASALATAGRAGSTSTCTDTNAPIFARDLRCWPLPSMDSVPSLGSTQQFDVDILTFRLLKPALSAKVGVMKLTGLSGAQRIDKTGAAYKAEPLTGTTFNAFPSSDGSVLAWNVPNTSFTTSGQIALSSRTPNYNPVTLSDGQVLFFAPGDSSPPLTLKVSSESGKRVANLSLNSDQTWTWNLKDLQNRTVPPGVYYYRTPGQPVKTVLILPP